MKELRHYITATLGCKTLGELRAVLFSFSQHGWTLEERSIISAIYVPIAMKMLRENEERRFQLEEFAALCWNRVVAA